MMLIREPIRRRVFQLFAELLDYPRRSLAGVAGECAALVSGRSVEAAALLNEFESFVARTQLTQLEEAYTAAFELDASCHPYVGYHLFGESYKRSAFLVGLKEQYRLYDIPCGVELPDHLALMLRYLAMNVVQADTDEVIRHALHPALRKMLKDRNEEPPDPDIPRAPARGAEYRGVLQALQSVLRTIAPDDAPLTEKVPVGSLGSTAGDPPGGCENA